MAKLRVVQRGFTNFRPVLLTFLALSTLQLPDVDGAATDFLCTGKGTLGHRLQAIFKFNDKDGNGVMTGAEIFDTLGNDYDTDGNGCVDKAEWLRRFENTLNMTKSVGELFWPGDVTSSCPLDINVFKTSPLKFSAMRFADSFISRLQEYCEADVSRYRTNCDCSQLLNACQNDKLAKTTPACFSLLSCKAKGSLAHRLQLKINSNDRNGDKLVTGEEFYKDMSENYDQDKDGCINLTDWVNRWTSYFKFSTDYAEGRYLGNESLPCPVDVNFYKTAPIKIPVDIFISDNIQTLVDVCQKSMALLTSNCDCAQLFFTCEFDDYFKTITACKNAVQKWNEGTFTFLPQPSEIV